MGSVVSGLFGGGAAKAAKSAGYAQTGGSAQAAAGIQSQFDTTRRDLSPFRQAADPALSQFQALLGLDVGGRERTDQESARLQQLLGQESALMAQERDLAGKVAQQGTSHRTRHFAEAFGPQLSQVRGQLDELNTLRGYSEKGFNTPEAKLARREAAVSEIQESPGQQFIRQRAQKNLLQNAAAIGGIGGGNVRSALTEQGAGFASQDLQNQFQRLQSLISGGQNAAAQTGQFGAQAAQNIGQLQQQGSQARASGILGAQQAKSAGLSNLVSLGGAAFGAFGGGGGFGNTFGATNPDINSITTQFFSDERLKTDISELSLEDCYNAVMNTPLKAWRYLEETGLDQSMHMGMMAQDAPDCIMGEDVGGYHTLDLNDELTLIMGALQYAHANGKVN